MCMKPDLGLLIVRLAVGIIFVAHGWAKLQGIEGTIAFFGKLGFAPFLAYLVALVELLGGIAFIVGFGTFLSGMALAIVMLVAIITVKWKMLSLMGPGGFEFELVLFAVTLGIALTGPGKYRLFKRCNCGCKDGVCNNSACDCKDCHCGCGNAKCDNCDMCKNGCNKHEMNK